MKIAPAFRKDTIFLPFRKVETENFLGTSPSVFVGRKGYPDIFVGLLGLPEIISEIGALYDAPREWGKRNFGISDVLQLRSPLVLSRFRNTTRLQTKALDIAREVGLASRPVDVEFSLAKKPVYNIWTKGIETVIGAHATLKKARIASNTRIHPQVEKVVSDTDLKSGEALSLLYNRGFEESFLTRMFSLGTVGQATHRRLVPTRWSITAIDDTIGKSLLQNIRTYREGDYGFAFGSYIGNSFLILFLPGQWSYELFEIFVPSLHSPPISYTTDYELFEGRKEYAQNCIGGYYASRLAVLESLEQMKRQNTVVVFRFISQEYHTPLGVWVVREAARKSVSEYKSVSSEEELLSCAQAIVNERFKTSFDSLIKLSTIWKIKKTQRKLFEFL